MSDRVWEYQQKLAGLRRTPLGRLFLDCIQKRSFADHLGNQENGSMRRWRAAEEASSLAHARMVEAIERATCAEEVAAFSPLFPSMTR